MAERKSGRYNVSLPDSYRQVVEELARAQRTSISEVLRIGIDHYLVALGKRPIQPLPRQPELNIEHDGT